MIGAGRMTYSPRRHWRFRARTISVRPRFAYGRVMTLVSFDDDLDWEFAFDSRLELPTGPRRSQWRRDPRNGARRPILHPHAAGVDESLMSPSRTLVRT
jgi:hypothetical protein